MTTTERVELDEVTLSCAVSGEGPVVLAVHGFPDDATTFRAQVPALCAAGYRVVCPTLRGYAPSGLARSGRYDAGALARDLVGLADRFSPAAPVRLVGHDWGAIAAFAAASLAPSRFSHLATLAVPHAAAFATGFGAAQARRSWYMGLFQLPGLAEARLAEDDFALVDRLWRDWSPGYQASAAELRSVKEGLAGRERAVLAYYRSLLSLRALVGPSPRLLLSRVRVPALHLHGADDGCVGVACTPGLGAVLRGSVPAPGDRGGRTLPPAREAGASERGARGVLRVSLFELSAVGGPWARRLARRRAGFEALPWGEAPADVSPEARAAAQWVWTQSAFSEYASAAAFAEIASCLFAAGAPLDLAAAAGDFVVDEVLHAEVSARVAMRLGGAVPLDVDLTRLVRPPVASTPLVRAAELLVRTSCVGEVLTVPMLKAASAASPSPLIKALLTRIARDESAHAQLGPWFLDWAGERLSDDDRAHLGRVAGAALRAFVPLFSETCAPGAELGVLDCASYDAVFAEAVRKRVVGPLAARGIAVPGADLEMLPTGPS